MYRFETAITLDEFSHAVLLGVDVESLLGEEEVSSLETSGPVRNVHNC